MYGSSLRLRQNSTKGECGAEGMIGMKCFCFLFVVGGLPDYYCYGVVVKDLLFVSFLQ